MLFLCAWIPCCQKLGSFAIKLETIYIEKLDSRLRENDEKTTK